MKKFIAIFIILCLAGCSDAPPAQASPTTPAEVAQTPPAALKEVPEVKATDQDGNPVSLSELSREGFLLVYFYPKADTPGCTAQACSLRDSYEKLTDQGVTVVGVSLDDRESQKKFQEKYDLPFLLIPDAEGKVADAFGVNHAGGYANREAFLIREGRVVWHDDSASTKKQAEDVLAQIEKLKS